MKPTTHDYSQAINLFTNKLQSLQMIANSIGVSRQAVKNYLNSHGINTSKKRLEVSCTTCGKKIKRPKCQIRNRINNYCSTPCYYIAIRNPQYQQHRQGQRIAHIVMEQVFQRSFESFIMHHQDGNNNNNNPDNILAFHNQSDHMKYHRGNQSVEAFSGKTGKFEILINTKRPNL